MIKLKPATTPKVAVGTPAPPEDPLYPFVNALVNDRAVKWRAIGPGADLPVVIDLGANKSVVCVGLLGFERDTGDLFPNSWLSYGYRTYPDPVITSCVGNGTVNVTRAGFDFAANGVKIGQNVTGSILPAQRQVVSVAVGTVVLSGTANAATGTLTFSDMMDFGGTGLNTSGYTDEIVEFAAPASARYVRFVFTFAAGDFTLGKFLVGTLLDLGIAYSPGSTETLVKNGVANRGANGAKLFTQTGQDTARMSMVFSRVPQTTKDALMTRAEGRVITLIHPTLGAMEAALADDELEATHLWSSPDLWDITLNLERMP